MNIVCACVPSFAVAAARLEMPDAGTAPLLVVDKLERGRVVACDEQAFALGARVGMTLLQAVNRAHDAVVAVDAPARNRDRWNELLDALDMASPIVEDAQQGVAFLNMRGMQGTPQTWLTSIRGILRTSGMPFTAACANNKSTAHLMARLHDGAVVVAGGEAQALAPLPIMALEMPVEMYERLQALGIAVLGELAALPYAPFVRRFGRDAGALHERARGIDTRLLAPRPQKLRIERAVFGEGSAASQDQLLFALRAVLGDFVADLATAGMRCGRLRCLLECEDGTVRELCIPIARPTAQGEIFFDLLKARLENVTLESPVTGVRLTAEMLEEGGGDMALFRGNEPDLDEVATTVARLCAFLSPDAVKQVRYRPAHRRDEAFNDIPVIAQLHDSAYGAPPSVTIKHARLAYRILVPRALPVACTNGMPTVVDGKRVLDSAGPWRFEQRWWSTHLPGDAVYRSDDQFDVLLETGALYRIAHTDTAWLLCGIYD